MHHTVAHRLAGITAIPVTPFDATAALDARALAAVVELMVRSGIDVVVPCGNTGEYASLTSEEARIATRIAVEASGDALVIAGVGGDLATVCAEARAAVAAGAAGIMVHAVGDPFINRDGLISYYRTVAAATDGVVVPYIRGRALDEGVLEALVAIDNVLAIKFAIPDLLAFERLVRLCGDRVVPICGLAEIWAPFFWLAGARGFTSGLVNLLPRASLELLDCLRRSDYDAAMTIWRLVAPFEELRARHENGNNVPAVKQAMWRLGLLDDPRVRPPLAGLSTTDAEALDAILATWRAARLVPHQDQQIGAA